MKYFMVKETNYHIVRADNEKDALRDYRCPVHARFVSGSAQTVGEPIKAQDFCSAGKIFLTR